MDQGYRDIVAMKAIHQHFSDVAGRYNDLRFTEVQPVLFMTDKLQHLTRIQAADVGCGTGRYGLKMFEYIG